MGQYGLLYINIMFVGNTESKFNNDILKNIKDIDYTLISLIDFDYQKINFSNYQKSIILIPITEDNYFVSLNIGWNNMIKSGFKNCSNTYTSIFLLDYEKINTVSISNIINNFDKENLVDNMWIYPEPHIEQKRSNNIKDLAWQQNHSN